MVEAMHREQSSEDALEPARHRQRPELSEVRASASIAPWTSARCNRLLRPISSKIVALRKARRKRLKQDDTPEENFRFNGYRASEIQRDSFDEYGRCPSHSATSVGPTSPHWGNQWMSSPRPLKKIKHTYSSKNRHQLKETKNQTQGQLRITHPSRETEIGLPRDFATSTSQENATLAILPESNSCLLQKSDRTAPPHDATCTTSEEWKIAGGVCQGLVALLKATSDRSPCSNGCRSLFSTCLRKVPAYIQEEELLSRIDDPTNDKDISSAVYNDLEEFGSRSGAGWSPLREVVRAHGVSMVREAIQDGTISPSEARQISSLCLAIRAYDEAQGILESLIPADSPADNQFSMEATNSTGEAQAIYHSLEGFASHTGRQGFVYRQTAAMINSGILPVDSMSRMTMIPHWNGMIRSISQGDEHALPATILMQATFSKWYNKAGRIPLPDVHDIRMRLWKEFRRPALRSASSGQAAKSAGTHLDHPHAGISLHDDDSDGLYDTIFNVLTVLSAIGFFTNSESAQNLVDTQRWSVPILQYIGLQVHQALEIASYSTDSKHASVLHLERLRLPLLAADISTVVCKKSTEHHQLDDFSGFAFLTGLAANSKLFGNAGGFLCAIARCCAKARSDDAFDIIKAMVNGLMAPTSSKIQDKATTGFWGQIALAAAFEFSEDTSQPNHLNWALDVELAVNGKVEGPSKVTFEKTPIRGVDRSKTGYRWEEGMCEWIARTPALVMQKPCDFEADGLYEVTSGTPIACLKQSHPLLSELTPCAINKRPIRLESRPTNAYMKAFDTHVNAESGNCNDENALDELRLATACQYARIASSNPRPSRNIHLDEDVDELSTADSLQDESSTLSALQGLPNKLFGVKRNIHTRMSQKKITSRASRRSTKHSGPRILVHRLEIDAEDLEDELGFP